MRFTFIDEQKKAFPVLVLCRVLKVSRSGFYAWLRRPVCTRAVEDERILGTISMTFATTYQSYGSPRMHRALRACGTRVGRKRVARLMRHAELKGRIRRRYRHTTDSNHDEPIAANLLARDFVATAPNQKWVVDTTEFVVGSRKRYLAAVVDLHARRIVGWAHRANNDGDLVIAALGQAISRRAPPPGLLHHSDRGSTYCSDDYRAMLDVHNFTASMSGTGNCYDNAAMESVFATIKGELGETFIDEAAAQSELFKYIEVFYNHQRLHTTLDYMSPADYEQLNAAQLSA